MRHVGRTNTGARCVVVDMLAPKEAVGDNKAFIVITDSLPPRLHDALMGILESQEGQQSERLGFVLNRHLMPDTGETIIQALNNSAKILSYPTNKVYMVPPPPHQPELLSEVLVKMGRTSPQTQQQQHVDPQWETQKFNPHTLNQNANISQNARATAINILREAEDLEAIARNKREEAYKVFPPLRPGTQGLPQAQEMPMYGQKPPSVLDNTYSDPAYDYRQGIALETGFIPNPVDHSVAEKRRPEAAAKTSQMEDRMAKLEALLMKVVSKLEPEETVEVKEQPTKKAKKVVITESTEDETN